MTLYFVRHATAGVRNNLDPSDDRRPLDPTGQARAIAIAAGWADRSVEVIYSSPALRCVQTVAPLAAELGLEMQIAPALFEGAAPSRSIEFVRSLTGMSAVLCSHGDVIPDILRTLEIGGTRLDGRGCAKGSIWTLNNETERIDSGAYLGPEGLVNDLELS